MLFRLMYNAGKRRSENQVLALKGFHIKVDENF